jgi:argininosuccinate lyase
MFQRDRERLADVRRRVNRLPLGAAALAGTTFPIDRHRVAQQLGFEGVIENSIDAVSDRDFLVEFLAAASLVMTHLSRFAEELILWTNPSFSFVHLADEFTTGSSIMPQKRNPDMAELLREKPGECSVHSLALLTLLKGTPLAYNRDFQEDKPPLFDAVETLEACLDVAIPMVRTLKVNSDKTRDACRFGFLLATDVADGLAQRGMPFREAHGPVAQGGAIRDRPKKFFGRGSPLRFGGSGRQWRDPGSWRRSVGGQRRVGATVFGAGPLPVRFGGKRRFVATGTS